MIIGVAERLCFSGIEELALELQKLNPKNALTYGVSIHERTNVVTSRMLAHEQAKNSSGVPIIARTREHFTYPIGQAVLMLDYDPPDGEKPLSGEKFRNAIYSIAPAIECAPHLLTVSASSCIYKGNECLRGTRGLRMLVPVARGTDIPRAGTDLYKRCWLMGYGRIAVSTAGTLLERALMDSAVWQPERLDFCGGAVCLKPLEQRRPAPKIFNPDAKPLDTSEAVKPLSFSEEEEVREKVGAAKEEMSPAAHKVRDKWIDSQVEKRLKELPKRARKVSKCELREAFRKAVENAILLGDFVLYPETGKGITVAKVLDDPDKWHGKRFADPLEPDYNNDKRIAYANIRGAGLPYIWSYAHGGRRFKMHRALQTIQINPGDRENLVRKGLELMKLNGSHFSRGSEIVSVGDAGEVLPRNKDGILYDLDCLARWEKYDGRKEENVPCDCKQNIATGVLAAKGFWGLPELTSVATAPVLDPKTGRIIDMDGFDKNTGVLLFMRDLRMWPGVPKKPNADQVKAAVDTLFQPFCQFPFDGPPARGVMLSSILTGMIRPLLETAPAHAYDAPAPGSGKTLLARCQAELAGENPAVLPNVGDEEEMRKRLLAVLRGNKRVVILDNVVGQLDSPALCAFLTSATYSDRVLGVSESIEVPTRTLLLITGNNICMRGDLCRRVLVCRIDPEMETPWKRRFEIDPAEHCRNHRLEIVAAALTVLRGGLQEGPAVPDKTASFEVWSDSVRRAIIWVGKEGFLEVEDPISSIDGSYELDPEAQKMGRLFEAWCNCFKDGRMTVNGVIRVAKDKAKEGVDALWDALYEIAGERGEVNPRRLGRWIQRHRQRIVGGRCFDPCGTEKRAKMWRVMEKG